MNSRGNYRFELADWMPKFPPTSLPSGEDEVYYGAEITSPAHLCQNMHLRQMLARHVDWGKPVPIDVFVMGDGEPKSRHNTKVGGLPCRPQGIPWPNSSEYEEDDAPATFLAQFCFADSKDIAGKLPGDVLLVFTDSDEAWPGNYLFEWYPLGLKDLITAEEVPEQDWIFKPCYGHICRVDTFPNARVISSVETRGFLKSVVWFNLGDGKFIDVGSGSFDAICGNPATRIGPWYSRAQVNDALPGKPVCELDSVFPHPNSTFPWVNRESPLSSNPDFFAALMEMDINREYFGFGDGGSIHISIDEKGQAYATLASG